MIEEITTRIIPGDVLKATEDPMVNIALWSQCWNPNYYCYALKDILKEFKARKYTIIQLEQLVNNNKNMEIDEFPSNWNNGEAGVLKLYLTQLRNKYILARLDDSGYLASRYLADVPIKKSILDWAYK
jgi:hypothetical protein